MTSPNGDAMERALDAFGARLVAKGEAFVTVGYQSTGDVHRLVQTMRGLGFTLVHEHPKLKSLDFMKRGDDVTAPLKPSLRARLAMTLIFCAMTLAALEMVGGHVTRLVQRLSG